MSFSKQLKEELSKTENLSNKEAVKYELMGYLISSNVNQEKTETKFNTENEYNINRFSRLLNNMNINNYDITIQGKIFTITVKTKDLIKIEISNLTEEQTRWVIRGAYLGSGSINNPEKKYHLEIKFSADSNKEEMMKRLEKQNIKMKELSASPILYLKEGEEISNFLAFIGASSGVLRFEEIRVMRDVRNNVNRLVNCETANLNKTINSAVKQIEDIKFIKQKRKFGELSEQLKEIAELRVTYPEKSFVELGQLLKEPIGKSGVSHRLKAISKFAEELRSK